MTFRSRLAYGDLSDVPVTIDQLMTSDPTPVQAAINRVAAAGGGDGPESNVESLYQIATGAGLAPWMPPAECPSTDRHRGSLFAPRC